WKKGTNDTLDSLPVSDTVMAIADADYFDWPVLPEAPSSLNAVLKGKTVQLSWQVHEGAPQHCVVERREDPGTGRGSWKRVGEVAASVTEYNDSQLNKGQQVSYRVRATNDNGESASSNVVRLKIRE
ncbi:MAG TPA: fibronectin type III domain-containing protein, partial [Candidatus Acidoferrum sp.]|nr:fibronectin type III domain-containing protein [Candidatus Acidoferrum sp.]